MKSLKRLKRKIRDSLTSRFPSLRSLIYLLQIDQWIVPALVASFLLFVGGIGTFLKIWTTTPEHFKPAVKISLFDRLQAWSLGRKAEALEKDTKFLEAKAAWILAAANNPGSEELVRRTLSILGRTSVTPQSSRETSIFGNWLLLLTRTNQFDVRLVLETLEHNRRYEDIETLLETVGYDFTKEVQAVQLRTSFHFGRYSSFLELWQRNQSALKDDALMLLYYLGVTAIRDRTPESVSTLQDAYESLDPYHPHFLASRQIALRVHASLQHTWTCKKILTDLVKRRMATLRDHLFYWHMLIRNGLGHSIADIHSTAGEPVTEQEALLLTRTLHMAGLKDASVTAAQKALQVFRHRATDLWLNLGRQLAQDENWHQLNRLAQRIYQQQVLNDQLGPIAKYWEALTAWNVDKHDTAQKLFRAIAQDPPKSPQLRLDLANQLLSLDHGEAADAMIAGLDGKNQSIQMYWGLRARSAAEAKNLNLLTTVTKAAYESNPDHLPHINNYLSALLGQRKEPKLALHLSQQLIDANPELIAFRLNRIHALCLNQMWDHASELIDRINPQEIKNPAVTNDYLLALFRLTVGQGDVDSIHQIRSQLNLEWYMPETAAWIENAIANHASD